MQRWWARCLISASSSGQWGIKQTGFVGPSFPFPKPVVPTFSSRSDKLTGIRSHMLLWSGLGRATHCSIRASTAQATSAGYGDGGGRGAATVLPIWTACAWGRAIQRSLLWAQWLLTWPRAHCHGPIGFGNSSTLLPILIPQCCLFAEQCSIVKTCHSLFIHSLLMDTWVISNMGLLSIQPPCTFL